VGKEYEMTSDEWQPTVQELASNVRMHLQRIADDGGILEQIENGEIGDPGATSGSELYDLLETIAARGRLDRLYLNRLANG
jgi:hypothetical protein